MIPWYLKRFIICLSHKKWSRVNYPERHLQPQRAVKGVSAIAISGLWFASRKALGFFLTITITADAFLDGPAFVVLDKPVELFGGCHVRVDLQLEGVANRKHLQ